MKTIKKRTAMSIGFLMMAGMLGCAYEPDNGSYGLGYLVRESSQYALAPKARWTCLHYEGWSPWGPFPDIRIFTDSHRIQFTLVELGKERPIIKYDHIATADEWRRFAGQLEKADFSRWKKSYEPDGVEVLEG